MYATVSLCVGLVYLCSVKLPQKKVVGSKARQLQRRVQQLDQVYVELKAQQNQDTTPKPLRLLEKVEKPIPRPPTPTVPIPDEVYNIYPAIAGI